jgi:hypothetical protein
MTSTKKVDRACELADRLHETINTFADSDRRLTVGEVQEALELVMGDVIFDDYCAEHRAEAIDDIKAGIASYVEFLAADAESEGAIKH